MLDEMGVDYTILSDPTEVLDTPADGEFRMYDGGTTQDEVKDAPNAKRPLSCCNHCSWRRPGSSSTPPGIMKCRNSTSRWAWSGPTSC